MVPSTRSVHTIEELRPYKSQFQSAGLAVTAADQLGPTCIPAKSKKDQFKMDWSDGPAHSARQQSFHSGTTVMAFTPPHEQADPRNVSSPPWSRLSILKGLFVTLKYLSDCHSSKIHFLLEVLTLRTCRQRAIRIASQRILLPQAKQLCLSLHRMKSVHPS